MGLFYTKELKEIFDAKIASLVLSLAENETLTNDRIVNGLKEIRCFRKFADFIIADLEEADRLEEEAKIAREKELKETAEAAQEAYDNLFDAKTWKKTEGGNGADT